MLLGTLFLALTVSTFAVPIDSSVTTAIGSKTCDVCEDIFARADEVVTNPKLIGNTVNMVDELICDRLPGGDAQAECNSTMSTKIPAIFNGIATRWLNPKTDCEELKLCHDKVEFHNQLQVNDLKCDICNKVVAFIGNNVLESQTVQTYVTEELDLACGVLPAKYSGLCQSAANASVPEILSYISTFIESNGCSLIGLCAKKSIDELIDYQNEFREFIAEFGKIYHSAVEFKSRLNIFRENARFIAEHSKPSLRLKMNEFGDMTPVEFSIHKKEGCFLSYGLEKQVGCKMFIANASEVVPDTVDWRTKGAVTPIKDQGQCGSCWSFSATGAMEGAYFVKTGKLISLSEQELVDCSSSFGNMGCNGGLMDYAFEFALENGMCTESEEPYTAQSMKCSKCNSMATFEGCFDVPINDEASLMKAVAMQPVSVAIEADNSVFMFYDGGIIDDIGCGTALDHGVLVVGYGEENGEKYWIVKNSWGESWGENGYVRIARDETKKGAGICGIASQPSFIVAQA